MRPMRSLLLAAPLLALAACGFTSIESGTPGATPSATLTPTATPSATPSPAATGSAAPTPAATHDPADVPRYEPGTVVATNADGMRIRRQPGVERSVLVELLPLGARLQVVLGPLPVDEFGWYLVADADEEAPTFGRGWIAAGWDPEPFIVPTDAAGAADPYPAGWAFTGDAEYGPVTIEDENYALEWAAVDPEAVGCRFAIDLSPAQGAAVSAVRATIGNAPTPGRLASDFFASQQQLRGPVFVHVTSDCAWALTVERVEG